MFSAYRRATNDSRTFDLPGAEPTGFVSGFKTAAPNTGPGRNKTPKERIKE